MRAATEHGLRYRTLRATARNALIRSFLPDAEKRKELERFDAACVRFERSVANEESLPEKFLALLKAAVAAW
jgi:adenosine deaminase